MIDNNTASILRLAGLLGLGVSCVVWALAERSGSRKILFSVSAGTALLSALVYFLGVMAVSDSGAHRFLPRFP